MVQHAITLPGAEIDINTLLDSAYDFRRQYDAIEHPDKEIVLRTLASVEMDSEVTDASVRNIGEIARIGTLYFGRAADRLAMEQAKEKEKARLQAEYDELDAAEKFDLGWRTRDRIRVDTENLEYSSAEVSTEDVAKRLIELQMEDAFNVAYQGIGRLPNFVNSYNYSASVPMVIASGSIIAKQVAKLPLEKFLQAASTLAGNGNMVAEAYENFARGVRQASDLRVAGEPAGYDMRRGEMGYGLIRHGRPGAGKYILDSAGVFWPQASWRGHDIEATDPDAGLPEFNEMDCLKVCRTAYELPQIIRARKFFPELTPELFLKIVKNIKPNENGVLLEKDDYIPKFEELVEAFGLEKIEDVNAYARDLLVAGHNDVSWSFYRTFRSKRIPAFEIFRHNIDTETFDFTQAITDGQLTDEHMAIGITNTGEAGLEQLKETIRNIEKFILSEVKTAEEIEQEIEKIQNSPLYGRLWRVAVRFNVAQFGSSDKTEAITSILYDNADSVKENFSRTPGLNRDIYKSKSDISINERSMEGLVMNPEAEKLIEQFCEVAKYAWAEGEMADFLGPFSERVYELKLEIEHAISEIELELSKDPSERKRLALIREKTNLNQALRSEFEADMLTDGNFLQAYEKLKNIKMAHSLLKEKSLRDAKLALGDTLSKSYDKLLKDAGVESDLSAALDVIEHLIVKEFLLKLRTGDPEYERFITKVLFNTSRISSALNEVMNYKDMVENPELIPKRTMRFVPTRDIGLELSGQIGDACWASRNGSIAQTKPSITGVLFSELEDGYERLVGSSLLLEATTEDGDDVLIVRGLNPIQNFVGQVDSHQFLSEFLDYARAAATRANRKLAIVCDSPGEASTNRPAVFNAILSYVSANNLKRVSVPQEQVEFNGYQLKDSVYLCA